MGAGAVPSASAAAVVVTVSIGAGAASTAVSAIVWDGWLVCASCCAFGCVGLGRVKKNVSEERMKARKRTRKR